MSEDAQPANRPRFNEVEREILNKAARAATDAVNEIVGTNHEASRLQAMRAFSFAYAWGEHIAENANSASHLAQGLTIMKAMLGSATVGSYAIMHHVDDAHPEREMIDMLRSAHQAGRTASTTTGDAHAETLGRTLQSQMERVVAHLESPEGCIKRTMAELAALVVICAQSMGMRQDMKLAAVAPNGEAVMIDARRLLDQIDLALNKAAGRG